MGEEEKRGEPGLNTPPALKPALKPVEDWQENLMKV